MSPLWRDEVAIELSPRRLALVRRSRGLRPRVVAEAELALPGGDAGDPAPAIARLAEVLADETWHGAAARVVVADHPWARYVVVPWPEARLDAAGRLAHARYVLSDAYGPGVADWSVALAETPPGRPILACAMPATLRGALEDALRPARLSLRSLQPRLIAAFNAWRRRLPAEGWFASLDEESLSAAHLRDGAWDRVHVARLSSGWSVELARLEAIGGLAGASGRIFVDAPERIRRGAVTGAGIEWLGDGDGDPAGERAWPRRAVS